MVPLAGGFVGKGKGWTYFNLLGESLDMIETVTGKSLPLQLCLMKEGN